jgi:hypothetical protein
MLDLCPLFIIIIFVYESVLAQLGVRCMKPSVSIIINVKIKTDELQSIHI